MKEVDYLKIVLLVCLVLIQVIAIIRIENNCKIISNQLKKKEKELDELINKTK